jgi:hypothetical protein
LLSKRE